MTPDTIKVSVVHLCHSNTLKINMDNIAGYAPLSFQHTQNNMEKKIEKNRKIEKLDRTAAGRGNWIIAARTGRGGSYQQIG